MRPLILASSSPQRRKLLRSLRVPFRIVPAAIRENSSAHNPRSLVLELAVRKARAVASRQPRGLILGADTVVVCRGQVLLKPKNLKDCARILNALNGRWHRVYTGVALVDAQTGKTWREVEVSRVKAKRLKPEEIKRLIGKHMDKSGAYAVQDHKDPFIERIEGPLDNVIGLPLGSVRSLLKRACRTLTRG